MAVLRDWILDMADGEPVVGVVIGKFGWDHDKRPGEDESPPMGILLSWDEARPHIEYEFDDDFGAPGCHAITAWTQNWVIGI